MKTKSLFISTIAMVVMLVVALSVGTFAWYASQDNVDASGATVGAVQSTDSAIGLGWGEGSNATANSVTLGDDSGGAENHGFRPMIPTSQPSTEKATMGEDNTIIPPTLAFNEALLKSTAGGGTYEIGSHKSATPWKQNYGAGTDPTPQNNNLFIKNLNANMVTVTTKVVINTPVNTPNVGANLNDLLRVTIYVGTDYIGTWGGTENAYVYEFSSEDYGAAPSSIEVTDNALEDKIATGDAGATFNLDALAHKQVWIYAWLEGTKLDTTNMHLAPAGFTVNFAAAQTESEQGTP